MRLAVVNPNDLNTQGVALGVDTERASVHFRALIYQFRDMNTPLN